MYFSEKFKQLRNDKGLTQEQIAEIFHLSPKSVSRWETGANYPDIDTLLKLSSFFDITVDELLEAEKVAKDEKAKECSDEIMSLGGSGKIDEAIKVARKAIKDHPLNAELHGHLVGMLSMLDEGNTENTSEYRDEIIDLSIRMINTVDYKSSLPNRVQLVLSYVRWGMKEEAQKMLDTLPHSMWDTQTPYINLVKEEDEPHIANFIMGVMAMTHSSIDQFLDKMDFSIAQKIEKRKTKLQIIRLFNSLAGIEDIQALDRPSFAYENINIARLCCEIEDKESALDQIEEAIEHAKYWDEFNNSQEGFNVVTVTPRNLSWTLWEDELAKPCFDLIRNEERFKNCIKTLKSNSRELK